MRIEHRVDSFTPPALQPSQATLPPSIVVGSPELRPTPVDQPRLLHTRPTASRPNIFTRPPQVSPSHYSVFQFPTMLPLPFAYPHRDTVLVAIDARPCVTPTPIIMCRPLSAMTPSYGLILNRGLLSLFGRFVPFMLSVRAIPRHHSRQPTRQHAHQNVPRLPAWERTLHLHVPYVR